MDLTILYIIALIPVVLFAGSFAILKFVIKDKVKNSQTIQKWLIRGVAIFTFVAVFLAMYHQTNAMQTVNDEVPGHLNTSVGNVALIGVPYGDNKLLNFFAWLSVAFIYPGAFIICMTPFWENKITKIIGTYIQLPVSILEFAFLFNVLNAIENTNALNYKTVFITLEIGSILALSIMQFFQYFKDIKKSSWKEILFAILTYFLIFLSALPVYTFSTLFSTEGSFFGLAQISLRVQDFTLGHRLALYITIIVPLLFYFLYRNEDMELKRIVLIAISLGALSVFTADSGAHDMFPIQEDGSMLVNVNNLPIHLCHTALYIVPICIAFKLNKLFYFTYFINVFGALAAMLFPNTGDGNNIFAPNVILFWYNHIAAFATPLLGVALGIFEKPKFKQMLWSLFFFFIYFVIIIVLNATLSTFVKGYDPNVVGSGTDYLFINSDYVLDTLFGKNGLVLLNAKITWEMNGTTAVIYPVYQLLFFVIYIAISFAMWFVYSLFFRISDSHIELHNKLKVARLEHIKLKERLEMEKDVKEIDHQKALLEFIHFSKRYGNSKKLSANDVNLTIHGGEIFGFLGPNGAGKSTCIKTTIGIQPVTEGQILVCGYDVTSQSVKSKKCIGYVPDHYALYEKLTGRQYINYIADLYGVSKADRDARIAKYVDLFELNQAFDNRMQTYSHGMKQKMTIMAALVHDPKIWILDEPLTGLDPQSIYQVKECMKEHAAKGNIVFFSSHLIDVVEKLCTRIAIIKKGQIVYEADMETVTKDHPEGLENFYMNTIRDNGDLDEE